MTGPAEASGVYRVVVTVGTDHHPFDRLVGWIDAWAGAHPEHRVLVQRGESPVPRHAESVTMMAYDELVAAMAAADAVVAQGGPGAIMDARSVGHRPVVVPRRGTLGEHVDDHQVTFTGWIAERELVWLAGTEAELAAMLDRAMADPSALRIPPDRGSVDEAVARFAGVVDPLVARRARRHRRR
ncbi:MAG: glycosyl transferase [Acidimicrobiales bacterium]|nr:glycosyl transferase [Acidimicrobiales bacterium]